LGRSHPQGAVTRIGTAGWSLPAAVRENFGAEGSLLQRYSTRFNCAEIDTSFYRPHRPQTYARWAASVPPGFRFAVKTPRTITHEARLLEPQAALTAFLAQARELGAALGPLLVQLPPSLRFEARLAESFLLATRSLFDGEVAMEPRHASWFCDEAEALLDRFHVGRVAADPAVVPQAATPGGWSGLRYWRLHGSPEMYHTPYGDERLRKLNAALAGGDWCIFDNTASGAATADALALLELGALG
jgi:uncharacterized protein YecE (DUF72 family)